MDRDFLGIHKPLDFKGSAGVGYVVIPKDVKRDDYIENCYRTQTVTIQGGYGYSEFGEVYVSQTAMQEIEFPTGDEGDDIYGSAVVWVRDDATNAPIIVATIRRQDSYYVLGEGTRRVAVNMPNGAGVEVVMNRQGSIQISVTGSEESTANVVLKASSPNEDSTVLVECDNEVAISAGKKIQVTTPGIIEARFLNDELEEKTVFRFEPKSGLYYRDEFENEVTASDGKINVVSKEIAHNEGNEPMVLGDTLADLLDDLLDKITALTVVTPAGTSSVPVNVAEFAAIKAKINTIKSKKSKLE